MKSFTIGTNKREMLTLTVLNYERPPIGESYDDNWLFCEVSVHAGAFGGKFQASFLASELKGLLRGLGKLHHDLRGDYSFIPLEGQLVFRVACDHLGHICITGEAMDQAGIGQKLTFEFLLDQTYLTKTLDELSDVVRTFPVRTWQSIQADTASRTA